MTRRPSATRALHQLERHRSGTPNTPEPEPTPIGALLASIAAGFNAAFTGPFWPLGQFPAQPDGQETT